MGKPKTIMIDDVEYVRNGESASVVNTDGLEYVIVRTYSAGVHAGYIKKRDGKEGEMINVRRLWYWDGAASLSQMALSGVSKPDKCKFSVSAPKVVLTEIIEILSCTKEAFESISKVKDWVA